MSDYGLCRCGCGEQTRIAYVTDRARGWVKGEPMFYVTRHKGRNAGGASYPARMVGPNRTRRVHVLIAESVLGRPLPKGAQVHHVNGNRRDNRHQNLVVCDSVGYHALLHQRQRALAACGHADWATCPYCHQYGPRDGMVQHRTGRPYHRECRNTADRARRARIHGPMAQER